MTELDTSLLDLIKTMMKRGDSLRSVIKSCPETEVSILFGYDRGQGESYVAEADFSAAVLEAQKILLNPTGNWYSGDIYATLHATIADLERGGLRNPFTKMPIGVIERDIIYDNLEISLER